MSPNVSDLKELKNPDLVTNITTLQSQINDVEKLLNVLYENEPDAVYRKLDAAGKATHDMFVTYAINSLFWVYLRTKGRDSANHAVKSELGRVREHMGRAKQLQERALAPRLDTGVAKRFIRGGLWDPNNKQQHQQEQQQEQQREDIPRPGKRKRGRND